MFGAVIKYDRAKGYGFIVSTDPTIPDLLVHCSDIQADKHHRFLCVGQKVEFDPIDIETKPRAINVRIVPITVARQTSAPTGERP